MHLYKGGIYRHDEFIEAIEDLGGIVMQKTPMQTEVDIVFAIPEYDMDYLKKIIKKLKGELIDIPFGDMEIAIVAPSLSRHHLPHPVCDMSEFLRRYGSTTNIVGLARGYGKTIFQISDKEKRIVSEHDAAIFSFGMFEECILLKEKELKGLTLPYVLCGGPGKIENVSNYVGNLGRKSGRMRGPEEIKTLEEVKNLLLEMVDDVREEIGKDPLIFPPVYVKRAIEQQWDLSGSLGDNPVVLHLDGLRIKKPFDEYHERISKTKVGEYELGKISTLKKSNMNDTIILTLKTKSEVGEGP
ncbi:MAG: methanogenesis marker 7 protein [Candidatus Methanofastidiosa archaeon]|nr:methanogenesis marker 7 protein [Candidatus Methanofastidiosa archaeon]